MCNVVFFYFVNWKWKILCKSALIVEENEIAIEEKKKFKNFRMKAIILKLSILGANFFKYYIVLRKWLPLHLLATFNGKTQGFQTLVYERFHDFHRHSVTGQVQFWTTCHYNKQKLFNFSGDYLKFLNDNFINGA